VATVLPRARTDQAASSLRPAGWQRRPRV